MRKLLLLSFALVLTLLQQAYAQSKTISGTVTDQSTSQGLPGVAVILKGTTVGTTTGVDGTYSISVPANGGTLIYRFVGYNVVERTIGNAGTVNVALSLDTKQLSEVVVTAVGIERKPKTIGYAIAEVKADEITQGRSTQVLGALQGKVAGVQINKSGGGVNSSTRVTLRGQRSFNGENQPLFVVDGIPIDNSSIQPSSTSGSQVDVGNRVNDINPDDIESMTVLKGPSAAALYGSRASNGAIIITTKSGKNAAARGKKAEVTFNTSYVLDNVMKLPDFQNEFGSGYDLDTYVPYENTNWGPKFDGQLRPVGPVLADGSQLMLPYTAKPDNVKDFFETGTTFQNSVSLAGGNEKSNFYLSFSDVDQKGVIPSDEFGRNTVKITGGTKLSNNITANASLSYNKNVTNVSYGGTTGRTGVYNAVLNGARMIDLADYKDWRNNKFAAPDGFFSGYYPNPYWVIDNNRFHSNLDRVMGNLAVTYDPLDWLSFTYRLGTDVSTDRRKQTFAQVDYNGVDPNGEEYDRPSDFPGAVTETDIFIREITSDALVTAKKNLTDDLNLQVIVGQNIRQRDTRQLSATANALSIPDFYNIGNRVGEVSASEESFKRRIYGVFGDITLGYRDYLFLNVTGRNDWSSTLSDENNSYFYPSTSLGFVFTEAVPALKDNNVLSYGKLRASYAKVGNDADPYTLQPIFSVGTGFPYGSLTSYTVDNTVYNPNLTPEFTTSYEVGAELSFFNNLVTLDATVYKTLSTNNIVKIATSPSSGYTGAYVNAGEISNKGIELALNATPVRTMGGFRWDIGVNYSKNNSIVESLYGDSKELAFGTGGAVPTAIVGESFPVLKGTALLRDPEGRVIIDPATGYPKRDPELKILGKINPDYIVGINNTFSYKGLSLSTVWDIRQGMSIYSGTKNTLVFTGSSKETAQYGRQPFVYPNSVVETSPGVFKPNTDIKTKDGGFDYWYGQYNAVAENNVIDASYVKLREAALTYNLPTSLIAKTPFGRATVAFVGRNLLLFVPEENEFIDPEASIFGTSNSQGREYNTTPSTRSYGVNLSVTF
ncbi:SusC/RagA family TonB-linked outer membrane protein [Pontibacter ummariensis]|nr:SusC/RagA family TonB-linked outer membrane protein [Pontibacter ummariensis]